MRLLISTGVKRLVVPKYSKSSGMLQSLLYILRRDATSSPTPSFISSSVIRRCVPRENTICIFSSGTPRRFISFTSTGMKSKLFATRVGSLQMNVTVSPGLMICDSGGVPMGCSTASSTAPFISSKSGCFGISMTFSTRLSSTENFFVPRP